VVVEKARAPARGRAVRRENIVFVVCVFVDGCGVVWFVRGVVAGLGRWKCYAA
jgi:hypothetical protein